MTAEEQMETNQHLAALGISPLAMQAIPLSMVYEEDIRRDETQKETIQIPSDSEEGSARQGAPAENKANPLAAEQTIPPDDNLTPEVHLAEFDPMSAMVVYSGKVNFINHLLVYYFND